MPANNLKRNILKNLKKLNNLKFYFFFKKSLLFISLFFCFQTFSNPDPSEKVYQEVYQGLQEVLSEPLKFREYLIEWKRANQDRLQNPPFEHEFNNQIDTKMFHIKKLPVLTSINEDIQKNCRTSISNLPSLQPQESRGTVDNCINKVKSKEDYKRFKKFITIEAPQMKTELEERIEQHNKKIKGSQDPESEDQDSQDQDSQNQEVSDCDIAPFDEIEDQKFIDASFSVKKEGNFIGTCAAGKTKAEACCVNPSRCVSSTQAVLENAFSTSMTFLSFKVSRSNDIFKACQMNNSIGLASHLKAPLSAAFNKSCAQAEKQCEKSCKAPFDQLVKELKNHILLRIGNDNNKKCFNNTRNNPFDIKNYPKISFENEKFNGNKISLKQLLDVVTFREKERRRDDDDNKNPLMFVKDGTIYLNKSKDSLLGKINEVYGGKMTNMRNEPLLIFKRLDSAKNFASCSTVDEFFSNQGNRDQAMQTATFSICNKARTLSNARASGAAQTFQGGGFQGTGYGSNGALSGSQAGPSQEVGGAHSNSLVAPSPDDSFGGLGGKKDGKTSPVPTFAGGGGQLAGSAGGGGGGSASLPSYNGGGGEKAPRSSIPGSIVNKSGYSEDSASGGGDGGSDDSDSWGGPSYNNDQASNSSSDSSNPNLEDFLPRRGPSSDRSIFEIMSYRIQGYCENNIKEGCYH